MAHVFAWPILIGIAGVAALGLGLLGGGPYDWLCWIGLALPCAIIAWAWRRRRRS